MREHKLILSFVAITLFILLSAGAFASQLSSVDYRITGDAKKQNSQVDISYLSQDPDPVEPGKYVTLRFKVENKGVLQTGDLSFKLEADYPFSFDRPDAAIIHIGSMLPSQSGGNAAILKYLVRVDNNAVEGIATVNVLSMSDGNDTLIAKSSDFSINIKAFESNLEIESINVTPEIVVPGSKGRLILTVKNLADSYIENVKVNAGYIETVSTGSTIAYRELPFTPSSDSNEKIIDHIESKESKTVTFDFIADSTAEPKIYKLPLSVKYYDSNGKNYTKNSIIGITVGDKPDIALKVARSQITGVDTSGKVSVDFINKGLTGIRRLYITLKDNPSEYEIIGPNNYYIGNIERDDVETAEFSIHTTKNAVSPIPLRMNVEYRDDNNKQYVEQIELPLVISTKNNNSLSNGIIFSSLGIIVTAILLLIVFRLGIKRGKSARQKA